MKFSELVPGSTLINNEQIKLNQLTGLMSDMILKAGDTYRSPALGIDRFTENVQRNQAAYRQNQVRELLTIALAIQEVRFPILHIQAEVFRNGIKWRSRFAVKCEACETEFSDKVEKCSVCNSSKLREPDLKQREKFGKWLGDSNSFDNSLEEILRAFHFDLNAVDDAFLYILKEFKEGKDGEIYSRPVELRRLHPGYIEFDIDKNGLPKNRHWVCLIHRKNEPKSEPGLCLECAEKGTTRELVPAMYKLYHGSETRYLVDSEVCHKSKFNPSEMYGYSPILSIFEKALTIMGMDKNVYRYFFERRMPASMIMVFTDDAESLRREREAIAARTRLDPNYIPMVAVSPTNGRGRVDMVRLFHTLQEMDYLPVRQEIRERIASTWGVTPTWQGAPDATGGQSSYTQQLTVMSRVVEADQRIFHEKVFPWLMDAFGITDWTLELPQPEEKAEATRIALAQQRANIAQVAQSMGFKVAVKNDGTSVDGIDFTISGEAIDMKAQMELEMEMAIQERKDQQDMAKQKAKETPLKKSVSSWMEKLSDHPIFNGSFDAVIKEVKLNPYENKTHIFFLHKGEEYEAIYNESVKDIVELKKATVGRMYPFRPDRAQKDRKPNGQSNHFTDKEIEDLVDTKGLLDV